MLDSINKNYSTVQFLLAKGDLPDLLITKTEYSIIKDLVPFLEEFKHPSMELEGAQYPTMDDNSCDGTGVTVCLLKGILLLNNFDSLVIFQHTNNR